MFLESYRTNIYIEYSRIIIDEFPEISLELLSTAYVTTSYNINKSHKSKKQWEKIGVKNPNAARSGHWKTYYKRKEYEKERKEGGKEHRKALSQEERVLKNGIN